MPPTIPQSPSYLSGVCLCVLVRVYRWVCIQGVFVYICLSTPFLLLCVGKGKVKSHRSTKTYCQGRYSHVPSFLSTSDVCLCFSYYSYEIRNTHTQREKLIFIWRDKTQERIYARATDTHAHTHRHTRTHVHSTIVPPHTHTLSLSLLQTQTSAITLFFFYLSSPYYLHVHTMAYCRLYLYIYMYANL